MASRIRLGDNTEYGAVWCGASDGVLNIELSEAISLVTAATGFSDPARTGSIAYLIDGTTAATFSDYTTLLSVCRDRWNGRVLIQLEKASVTDMLELIDFEYVEIEEE